MRGKGAGAPRAGACARRARARARAPPAGGVAPPPSLLDRPPRWPRRPPPLAPWIVALCVLSLELRTSPHAHEARPTLNHATNAVDAQAATSARHSLRPVALPTARPIHHSPTRPTTPLAYSNSLAREYQARAARVVVRGFHMLVVTGSAPSAGSVSHRTDGLQTSFLARSVSDHTFLSRESDNVEHNPCPA
jgi:hypothetical protein